MQHPYRILVVGPALKMGGMERAACNLANGFHACGYPVSFAAIFDQPVFFKLHPDIPFHKPTGFNTRTLNMARTLGYLRKMVATHTPEVIIVYNKFYAAITLLAVSFLPDRPLVLISERSSPFYRWSKHVRIFNRVVYTLFPPDGIIAQTRIASEYQRKYYPERSKIKVIPNILREVILSPQVRQPYILAIGRFNDHLKGFDRLIHAFAKIDKQGWKIAFIGGERGQDKAIDELIEHYQLNEHVEYHGKVEDVDPWLSRASIFVIPSRSEGFPNALAEAMSAGLACISFDFVAGPRDIIQHEKNGLLVPEGDVGKLAQAIQSLMQDPSLRERLGKEAVNVRDRLGVRQIINEHITFLDQLKRSA